MPLREGNAPSATLIKITCMYMVRQSKKNTISKSGELTCAQPRRPSPKFRVGCNPPPNPPTLAPLFSMLKLRLMEGF